MSESGNTNSLESAVSSLGQQAKKYDIAFYYTHGDEEKTKQMVSGGYKDLFVIKSRFASSTVYGGFLFFFNEVYSSLVNVFSVVSHSFELNDIKTNIAWREYENEAQNIHAKVECDDVLASHLNDELMSYFNVNMQTESKAADLQKLLQKGDEIAVNLLLQKFIINRLGFQNVDITADIDRISSVDMELFSTTSKKIDPRELQKDTEKDKPKEPEIEKVEEDPLSGKEVKLILNGSILLSPIKGKDIGLLEVRDKIRINILDAHAKAVKVARAFNAYEDGIIKPIVGRVVSVRKRDPHGFLIFAIIAKGIFVKIEEEEENIKVALDPSEQPKAEEPVAKKSNLAVTILVSILIILIIVIVAVVI